MRWCTDEVLADLLSRALEEVAPLPVGALTYRSISLQVTENQRLNSLRHSNRQQVVQDYTRYTKHLKKMMD